MVSVENRFMIEDLHRRGMTISGIARMTGLDRKTHPLTPGCAQRESPDPRSQFGVVRGIVGFPALAYAGLRGMLDIRSHLDVL